MLAVIAYPLIRGFQISTEFYRFGRPLRASASTTTARRQRQGVPGPRLDDVKFVFLAVPFETVLGLGLALLCVRELPLHPRGAARADRPDDRHAGDRRASCSGSSTPRTSASYDRSPTASAAEIGLLAGESSAFLGVVALDVWEWTPLMFLILLAGLQSLPQEPFEAAKVDGAGSLRTFLDHTLPLMRPVLVVAIVLRTLDAFTTFDQIYVLTQGGPGTSTQLIADYGYDSFFRFQRYGFAAAMLIMARSSCSRSRRWRCGCCDGWRPGEALSCTCARSCSPA